MHACLGCLGKIDHQKGRAEDEDQQQLRRGIAAPAPQHRSKRRSGAAGKQDCEDEPIGQDEEKAGIITADQQGAEHGGKARCQGGEPGRLPVRGGADCLDLQQAEQRYEAASQELPVHGVGPIVAIGRDEQGGRHEIYQRRPMEKAPRQRPHGNESDRLEAPDHELQAQEDVGPQHAEQRQHCALQKECVVVPKCIPDRKEILCCTPANRGAVEDPRPMHLDR